MDGSAVHLHIEHVIEVSRQYALSGEGGNNAREVLSESLPSSANKNHLLSGYITPVQRSLIELEDV